MSEFEFWRSSPRFATFEIPTITRQRLFAEAEHEVGSTPEPDYPEPPALQRRWRLN